MSSKPTKKAASKQATAPPSKKSSTAKKKEFDPALAMATLEKAMATIERQNTTLATLEDFHADVAGVTDEDIRVHWEVRVIRGVNEPFAHTQGVSALPGVLAPKMKGHATVMIQDEITHKIVRPLVAAFMLEAEEESSEEMKRIGQTEMHRGTKTGSSGENVLELAEGKQEEEPSIRPPGMSDSAPEQPPTHQQ